MQQLDEQKGSHVLTGAVYDEKDITESPKNYPFDENLFGDAPTPYEDARNPHEELAYEEVDNEDLVHPPDFRAFFTLIEDPETGEHHHPTVHYMFKDDDPDILTSAVLETLDGATRDPQTKKPSDETADRYVVVDIAADGKSVTSVSSISSDWQALKTSIAQAPSWGEDNASVDRGLMLKISGRQNGKAGALKENKRRQEAAGNIDELVKSYEEGLEGLEDILGRS